MGEAGEGVEEGVGGGGGARSPSTGHDENSAEPQPGFCLSSLSLSHSIMSACLFFSVAFLCGFFCLRRGGNLGLVLAAPLGPPD